MLSPRTSNFSNLKQSTFKSRLSANANSNMSLFEISSCKTDSTKNDILSSKSKQTELSLFEVSSNTDSISTKTNHCINKYKVSEKYNLSPISEELNSSGLIQLSSDSDSTSNSLGNYQITDFCKIKNIKPSMYDTFVVSDMSYYKEITVKISNELNNINYLVAKRGDLFIRYHDFKSFCCSNTTNHTKWLNDETLTYLLDSFLANSHTVGYLNAGFAYNSIMFNVPFYFETELRDITVLPVNVDKSHWCLAIVNKPETILEFYDPQQTRNGKEFFEQFTKKFVKSYNEFAKSKCYELLKTDDHWKLKIIISKYKQVDGWSCGYFILYYIEQVVCKKDNNFKLFDPWKYRSELSFKILNFSESLACFCIYCSRCLKANDITVQCENCERTFHKRCKNYFYKIKNNDYKCLCILCSK